MEENKRAVRIIAAFVPLFFTHMCLGMAQEICIDPHVQHQLYGACDALDKKSIVAALQQGAILSAADDLGYTVLHHAIVAPGDDARRSNVVRFLLKNGAQQQQQNAYGLTPLDYAFWRGNKEIIELLGGAEDVCPYERLMKVFERHWQDVSKMPGKEQLTFPIFMAIECANPGILGSFFSQRSNWPEFDKSNVRIMPTVYAASIYDEFQSFQAVNTLAALQEKFFSLKQTELINSTACIEAIYKDHATVVEHLLKVRKVSYGVYDSKSGNSLLHHCVAAKAIKCMALFCEEDVSLMWQIPNVAGKTPSQLYQEMYIVKSAPSSPIGSPRSETNSPALAPIKRKRQGSFTKKLKELKGSFHSASSPTLRQSSPQITKLTSSTEGIKEGTKKGGI